MSNELTLYEGMFLYDPADVGSSTQTAIDETERILNHVGASIEAISKYDDRKLAYEIGKTKRGLYILTHFRVDGDKIASIERAVNLSEVVLRVLILKADHVGDVELEAAKEAAAATRDAVALEGTEAEAAAEGEATDAPAAEAEAEAEAPAAETSTDGGATEEAPKAEAPAETASE